MLEKRVISHFIVEGDSLTERGEMSHRRLFGLISMNYLSGLAGKSPLGRFCNRFTWADHFFNRIIQHLNDKLKEKNSTEIGNDEEIIGSHYFDNYKYISYQGHDDFVRCYAEGGLSAHDYSWAPSKSIARFFSRLILTTLGDMRERLFEWDNNKKVSKKQKAQTLVIEWSGANDFVTVNEKPSEKEASLAVKDRLSNVKKLIKKGYRNFVLFNLPDLSLTPRFQDPTVKENERKNASQCTTFFNQELIKAQQALLELYPYCKIEIFDVNTLFKNAYNNPEVYGFEIDKKNKSYCDSADFKNRADDPVADEYMFWNDLHPSDRMHGILAKEFNNKVQTLYTFQSPATVENPHFNTLLDISTDKLINAFQKKYEAKLNKDKAGCFGFFRRSNMPYKNASLEDILRHALYGGGERTREVIRDLQWINHSGELNLNIKVLQEAMANVIASSRQILTQLTT